MHTLRPTLLAEEGHHHQSGHVEGGDGGTEHGQHPERCTALPSSHDDVVLGVETGQRRDADDRQVAHAEGHECPGHHLAKRSEVPHVGVVVHGMHHRSGAQEHVGLEEAVGEQVEDRESATSRPDAGRQHHVADLAHRRACEHLLDVVLGGADPGASQQGDHTDNADGQRRRWSQLEDDVAAHYEVDASGDHGRSMDERRDGGGALHGVQQPGLQRNLRRLAASGEQQQEPDRGDPGAVHTSSGLVHLSEVQRTEHGDHDEHRDQQTEVTDAVDDEGLLGGQRGAAPLLPEADQQVGRQTDAFPADEQDAVAICQHQRQHRGDEDVHEREEAPPIRILGHVADRVDEDQRAHARDQQGEQDRQLVYQQRGAQVQVTDTDPLEHRHLDGAVRDVGAQHLCEQRRCDSEGADHAEHAQPVPPGVGGPATEQQDGSHPQRDRDHQPGVLEQPSRFDRDYDFQRIHQCPLSTSAGSGRRPRPSAWFGR